MLAVRCNQLVTLHVSSMRDKGVEGRDCSWKGLLATVWPWRSTRRRGRRGQLRLLGGGRGGIEAAVHGATEELQTYFAEVAVIGLLIA